MVILKKTDKKLARTIYTDWRSIAVEFLDSGEDYMELRDPTRSQNSIVNAGNRAFIRDGYPCRCFTSGGVAYIERKRTGK